MSGPADRAGLVAHCPTHGEQEGYHYGGPRGPLICAVPSADGGMCHRPLQGPGLPEGPVLDASTLEVRRWSASGSNPWAIYHIPTGSVLEVEVESPHRPGLFYMARYHRRKMDAQAGLDRFLAARERSS